MIGVPYVELAVAPKFLSVLTSRAIVSPLLLLAGAIAEPVKSLKHGSVTVC